LRNLIFALEHEEFRFVIRFFFVSLIRTIDWADVQLTLNYLVWNTMLLMAGQ